MKSILVGLVLMITLSTTTCQIGNWIYSSQNIYQPGDCIPGSILISQSGNTTFANYTYNQVNPLENCPSNFSLYETANLTNKTNVFSDTIGQKLTYSPTNSYQSLTLTLPNKHVYYYYNPDLSVLFSEALEGLSATWTNPTANASSNATCYPPTSLFTAPGPQFALNGQILLQMYYQSNYVSHYLYPASTSVSVLTWVDNTTNPDPALQISLAWLPNNSPVTLNFTFYYVNNTCDYIYDRSSALFLTGTMQYLLDWQSAGVASSELTLLPQVTDNINYLQSRTYNTSFGSFTQTPLGQYYESTMGLILTYDSTTNTFLNTSAQVLYSKTGSFLSSSSFVQSWGAPQVVGNSGSAENCCVPNYINITADPNNPQGLNVTYVLPSNYSTTGGCNEYITDIENGQLQSTLTIQKPSLTQLTWTDGFGTQLYFTRNGNTSQISVQFLQQCVFTMSPTTQPLFGSLTSVKVMELVIGFFILLACI